MSDTKGDEKVMSKYVIGIDGGGTGSKGITADMNGDVLLRFTGGATNYNGANKKDVDANIQHLLKQATVGLKVTDCQAVCIGSAGVSNPSVVKLLENAVKAKGFTCPVMIVGDSMTAHAGALKNKDGIILIAGTGAICFGRKGDGQAMRVGGYGHLIDDEGSGYDIARRMVREVVRAADGRAEDTVLRSLIFDSLGFSHLGDMIAWLYDKERSKKEIAGIAVLLDQAVKMGDKAAERIVEEAADALVDMTVPIVDFFEGNTIVALSGSVLKNDVAIRESYIGKMKEHYPDKFGEEGGVQIQDAEYEADHGAVFLALNYACRK